MKLSQVREYIDGKVLIGEDLMDTEVIAAFGSDLMSDVMAFVKGNVLLITGLINLQVIRTAEMLDIKAIVFVRGKSLSRDVLELAKERQIVVLSTPNTMYETCGKLYFCGLAALDLSKNYEK